MFSSECEYFSQGQAFHGFVPLVMGTRLDVLLCGASQELCGKVWTEMCAVAQRLERLMNRFSPESEVFRVNAAGVASVSREMADIITLCERYRKSTCGLFDIGKGTVDWDSVFVSECSGAPESGLTLSLNGGNLDFGGFGKGYLLKKYASMLKDNGISTAYIDFGGSSILAVGHHPYGDCWRVGVTDPFTGSVVRTLELVDMAMSTSGNQPGYDGHIIDPRDGSPVSGRRMVTVLSPDPLAVEVVSTAAMIANDDELRFILGNNDITTYYCL